MKKQFKFIQLSLLTSSLLLIGNSYATTNNENDSNQTADSSLSSISRSTDITASYNMTSLILDLPIVSIGSDLYYKITMKLISGNTVIFDLTDISETTASSDVSATYDANTRIISIPELDINGEQISLDLKFNSALPDYQFEVYSYTGSYQLVDTGQTNCYNSNGSNVSCNNSGQDAAYNGNQPSYTNNQDGTITDNVSGLVWQRTPDTSGDGILDSVDKLTQPAALSYCSNLVLANQNDWRLPDIKTMYSLIDFSGEDVSGYTGSDTSALTPFINNNYFTFAYGNVDAGERIIDVQYATSTLYVSTTMSGDETMFGVNMADGRIKGYGMTIGNSEKSFTVQCVRGNEIYANNNFINNNDLTITDAATALMWQQNDSSTAKDWDAAISYCESDVTAGYSDWRLPNAKELQGILDYTRSPDTTNSAAINSLFNATSMTNEAGNKDWGFYWSSTTHKNSGGAGDNAVYVAFGRALGYMNNQWMDVHGAGAQRSNFKVSQTQLDPSYETVTDENGNQAIIHGPQGDVVRSSNFVRCVR